MLEAKKRTRERWKAAPSPSIPEIRRHFKKSLAEMSKQIMLIQSEITRATLAKNIEASLMAAEETRDYDQLVDMICSDIAFLRIHIAMGLYGLVDPRTQKIMDDAMDDRMCRALMEDQRKEIIESKRPKDCRSCVERELDRAKRLVGR